MNSALFIIKFTAPLKTTINVKQCIRITQHQQENYFPFIIILEVLCMLL